MGLGVKSPIHEGMPGAKAGIWVKTDANETKAWGANGIWYPGSPRCQR